RVLSVVEDAGADAVRRDLAGPAIRRAVDRLAGIGLAGAGLRHARHAGAALGRRAAVGLALLRQRVAELTHRAGHVPAGVGLAEARHAALAVAAFAGDAEVLARAGVAVLAALAGDAHARVGL